MKCVSAVCTSLHSWGSGVSVISLLRVCFRERKWPRFCPLCVPFLNSSCLFFPPLSSHLICSSFCWTLRCPSPLSPLFSPTAPPTTPYSSTYCIILLLFPAFYSLSSCHMPRFIRPLGTQVHNIVTNSLSEERKPHSTLTRAVTSVHSRGVHVNGVCIVRNLWSFFVFFVGQPSWHIKWFPCWWVTQKTQHTKKVRNCFDSAWVRKH